MIAWRDAAVGKSRLLQTCFTLLEDKVQCWSCQISPPAKNKSNELKRDLNAWTLLNTAACNRTSLFTHASSCTAKSVRLSNKKTNPPIPWRKIPNKSNIWSIDWRLRATVEAFKPTVHVQILYICANKKKQTHARIYLKLYCQAQIFESRVAFPAR